MSADDGRRGNVQQLAASLASSNINDQKTAMKTIISAMTCGEDVSMFFAAVVRNTASTNLELKKLNYLYIINYAKAYPDQIIMAIESFKKDALEASNPILRALAIRTMGCIRVSQMTEYLVEPLKEALKDEDSYVRKTGVVCIAKLYQSSPELIESLGFIRILENLLTDGNAMVVSNAIAILEQLSELKGENLLKINDQLAVKLINAWNEANEWGKTYILDAMAKYEPSNPRIAEEVLDRLSVNVSHANPGIVLSTIRIIVKFMDYITNNDLIRNYCTKVSQTLITLINNAEHEFKYVVLKNINIIIQKRPLILHRVVKVFFCSHNDPYYVKIEKLEVLLRLADDETIDLILLELKEYVTEVDMDFVRKCIGTFGKLAIKLESSASHCVQALYECLKSKQSYIIQETIIVMRDVFRRYPRKYEGLLAEVCKHIKDIDEPEAKSALVWIIGEYIEIITNGNRFLASYLEGFREETTTVQIQILTSCIKLLIVRPEEGSVLVKQLFQIIEEIDNPDLRDRGYFYWRMLGKNKDVATKVVAADKQPISDMIYNFESNLLEKLVDGIGTLTSIYYKEPEAFVKTLRESKNQKWEEQEEEQQEREEETMDSTGRRMGSGGNELGSQNPAVAAVASTIPAGGLNLLGDDEETPVQKAHTPAVQQVPTPAANPFGGQAGLDLNAQALKPSNIKIPMSQVLQDTVPGIKQKRSGLRILGSVQREGLDINLYLEVENKTETVLSNFAVMLDANSYKLAAVNQMVEMADIAPGTKGRARIPLAFTGKSNGQPPTSPFRIQVALNTNIDIFTMSVPVSFSVLLQPARACSQTEFQGLQSRPNQVATKDNFPCQLSEQEFKAKLEANNINFVGQLTNPQSGVSKFCFDSAIQCYHAKTVDGMDLPLQVVLRDKVCHVNFQTPHPTVNPLFFESLKFIRDF